MKALSVCPAEGAGCVGVGLVDYWLTTAHLEVLKCLKVALMMKVLKICICNQTFSTNFLTGLKKGIRVSVVQTRVRCAYACPFCMRVSVVHTRIRFVNACPFAYVCPSCSPGQGDHRGCCARNLNAGNCRTACHESLR